MLMSIKQETDKGIEGNHAGEEPRAVVYALQLPAQQHRRPQWRVLAGHSP